MAECYAWGKHMPAAVAAAGVSDPAADADRSELEVQEVLDPQTPKSKGKTDKQRQKEQEAKGGTGAAP